MTQTTKAPKELSAEVTDLAAKLAKKAIVIVENEIKFDEAAYVGNLPEGVTEEHIKLIQGYNGTFFPAAEHAVGSAASDMFKKHKDIQEFKTVVKLVGKDNYAIAAKRSATYPDVAAREAGNADATITKHNIVRGTLETHAVANGGELKKVRAALSHAAAELFGK